MLHSGSKDNFGLDQISELAKQIGTAVEQKDYVIAEDAISRSIDILLEIPAELRTDLYHNVLYGYYTKLGHLNLQQEKYVAALKHFNSAADVISAIPDSSRTAEQRSDLALAQFNLNQTYTKLKNFVAAEAAARLAVDILKRIPLEKRLQDYWQRLGKYHASVRDRCYQQEKYAEAKEADLAAISVYEEIPKQERTVEDWQTYARRYIRLGWTCDHLKEHSQVEQAQLEAIRAYEQIPAVIKTAEDWASLAKCYHRIGRVASSQENFSKGEQYNRQAIEILTGLPETARESDFFYDLTSYYSSIAGAYHKQFNYIGAAEAYRRTLEFFAADIKQTKPLIEKIKAAYRALMSIYPVTTILTQIAAWALSVLAYEQLAAQLEEDTTLKDFAQLHAYVTTRTYAAEQIDLSQLLLLSMQILLVSHQEQLLPDSAFKQYLDVPETLIVLTEQIDALAQNQKTLQAMVEGSPNITVAMAQSIFTLQAQVAALQEQVQAGSASTEAAAPQPQDSPTTPYGCQHAHLFYQGPSGGIAEAAARQGLSDGCPVAGCSAGVTS